MQGTDNRLHMRDLQTHARLRNDRPHTRNETRSAVRVRSSALYLVVISRLNSARQRGLESGPRITNRNPPKTCVCSNEGMAAQRIDCAYWLGYLDGPL